MMMLPRVDGHEHAEASVPCVRPSAPLVGTGVEKLAAENSGYCGIG